jgi:hypothetical protein
MRPKPVTLFVVSCGLAVTVAGAGPGGSAGARPVTADTAIHRGYAGSHASSPTVTVTRADNGGTVRLRVGGQLDVQLSGPSGVTWTEASSSKPTVLRRTGGSSGTASTTTFVGVAKGKVEVTATGDGDCPVCLGPIFGFQVTVRITG